MTTVATHMSIIRTAVERRTLAERLLAKIPGSMVYERGTREVVNHWLQVVMNGFGLSAKRQGFLRRTLKRDLPSVLRQMAVMIISDSNEAMIARAGQIRAIQGAIVNEQRRRNASALLADLAAAKPAFMDVHVDIDQRLRQFRAATVLAECGAATREDLVSFGFKL